MKQFRVQRLPEVVIKNEAVSGTEAPRATGGPAIWRNRSYLNKVLIKKGAVSAPEAPRAAGGPASWPESVISF